MVYMCSSVAYFISFDAMYSVKFFILIFDMFDWIK